MKRVVVSNTGATKQGVRYVGTNQSAIQQAVNYLRTTGGGTCFIENGTYTISTPIILPSNIEICGEGRHSILKNTTPYSSNANAVFKIMSNQNIYIHDLFIGNLETRRTSGFGIYMSSTLNSIEDSEKMGVIIENCIFERNGSSSICFEGVTNSIIKNNIIEFNEYDEYLDNVQLYGCFNVNICNNSIANNSGGGIYIYECEEIKVSENTIWENMNIGIAAYESYSISIYGNIINSNDDYGIRCSYLDLSEITNNMVNGNYNAGIELSDSDENIVKSNIISNNDGGGIYMDYATRNSIVGNTIVHNDGSGLAFYSASYNTFVGNMMYENGYYGIRFNNQYNENNTINGNIFTDTSYQGTRPNNISNNDI